MRHEASVGEDNRPVTATSRPRWLVLLTLALVALNLRIALSSVPTVEPDIADATGWSATVIGALTQLPVLCMGAFALLVPRIARQIGRRHTVALALALITIALVLRLAALVPGVLHLSALVAGIGIALAGGLVPSIVREQLPTAVGMATGLWTAAMMGGAALGGALTVPLAEATGSWQVALALWAIPAALALTVWWLVEERGQHEDPTDDGERPAVHVRDLPWRDRRAGALTLYLLLNSIVFYTALAWLAPSYVDRGQSQGSAGLLFGLFTASQILGALVMPSVAERVRWPRAVYAMSLGLVTASVVIIGVAPDLAPAAMVCVFGSMLGAVFAMGLALLSQWAVDAAASARLTAMAFSVTYLTASFGPLLAGLLLDLYGSWPTIYVLLAVVCLLQFATIPALRRGVRVE
jgi:CP family cyanate transporter-like MFS transporter